MAKYAAFMMIKAEKLGGAVTKTLAPMLRGITKQET